MKQILKQTLMFLVLLMSIASSAWAQREVQQLQFGKQTITVASDEEITFVDPKGDVNYSGTTSENAQSLTVFVPAEDGMSIQITFESMNMGGGGNYYSFVNVYDGNPDADDSFTWATSTGEVPTSYSESNLPAGNILRAYPNERDKTYTDETYFSSASDGSLSVGFAYRYAYSCTGWVAKVKAVKLAEMHVTGAASDYSNVVSLPNKKTDLTLANVSVTAEGISNADRVTGIWFSMIQNEEVVNPLDLRLYKGSTQVEATVSADGDGYKFTLDEACVDGTVTFTIKGDISDDAAIGAKVEVAVTAVATRDQAEGVTPFTAAQSVAVENPAIVLMSPTGNTFTLVDGQSVAFYDEGGIDGGILSKTNGQTTFLSGTEGMKVMLDFTENKIWHGSLYNQELRIYSGQTVSAENLIKTLQQGETGIVRSTADDGSLTVVLFSDASNSINADGWVATASLFVPMPMEFNQLTASAASTASVAAGDTEQEMLNINVNTLNTEPAMSLISLSFNAGDNYALVSKASLYSGTTKLGETTVDAPAFSITLDAAQTLVEGDNLFVLKYDISDEALNEQQVFASLVSATAIVNNAETTETASESAQAIRTVENVVLCYANMGTQTRTVNGSLTYKTQTTSSYSSYCEAGTDNRVITFVPKHEGMVAQIEFTQFNVQYASTSYGNKSKFIIYSGNGTNGDILWQLNDNSQESTGPSSIIRSTADDGSLTILFNPNTSYSYYYKGFEATVSEYLSQDMHVLGISAEQASQADLSIGASQQELLTLNVQTEGNLNRLTLNAVSLNLKGSETNLTGVSLWQGENQLGSADAASDVSITLDTPVQLSEGNNIFTVKVDVSEEAVENQTVDAQIVSALIGTETIEATEGDPEGSRTLKNQILLTAGDHGTHNIGLGKTVNIYDDGGPEAGGEDGVEATITLMPSGSADCIRLTDLGISFNYSCHLYIYSGSQVDDDKLIVDLSGSSAKFEPIISDSDIDGGSLTIKYIGKGSYTKPNFAIQAEGYKKSDVVITSVTVEDISTNEVLRGQTDIKMLQIAVEAEGELTPVSITAFNIDGADGEAVEAIHIYATGTTSTFSANTAFSGSYNITKGGTYYFWLTYDVKTTAEVGQTASATLNSISVGEEQTIEAETAVTALITVATGKKGTYTVGLNEADYTTIQSAIDDFGVLGIEGPVTLKIQPGSYNEKVRIPYIKGMGSVNTLTIESESGQRDVQIYHNQYTTAGYSDDQHKKDYGVITLYQASYVTLRNLEVYTTDVNYKAVVMIKDESRHATIDHCYLHAPTTTTGDVCLVGHTIIDEENKNNDYLTVTNCLLEGGKIGVSMGGTGYVSMPKEVGGIISANTLKNNGTKSIYVMDELGAQIIGNTVIIDADADTKISVGILDMQLRDEYDQQTIISGNTFNVAPATYAAVMNLRQLEGTPDAPVLVTNNVINLTSLNASYSAIKFGGGNVKNVNIANNTLRITGSSSGAVFWASSKIGDGYGNINVVNNIIQNEANGYAVNLYNDDNLSADKVQFANNTIYTNGETLFRASSGTSGDFDAFVEATGASNCINEIVEFLSDDILEPANTLSDGSLLTAQQLTYVTTDISGTPRSDTPTIGAYEYSSENNDPVIAEGYPLLSSIGTAEAVIAISVDANGTAYAIVQTADQPAPDAEALIQNGQTVTVQKDNEATIKFTELDSQTDYIAYLIFVNTRGHQTPVQTLPFTTATIIPDVAITSEGDLVNLGEEATLTVQVTSGTAPFQIQWLNGLRQVVAEGTLETTTQVSELGYTPTYSDLYYVTVTDANMRSATDTTRVIVHTPEPLVADFENLYLDNESYWFGPDTKGVVTASPYGYGQDMVGSFPSGSYEFSNSYNLKYSSWSGFAYTNRTATDFKSYTTDQYNSVVGHGVFESSNYAVIYSDAVVTPLSSSPVVVPGFYVTNTANTRDCILNGDYATGPFATGDHFTLTITGHNGNETTGTVEFKLADYTSENEEEHYYVSDWQYVDLTSLGEVTSLSFSFSGGHSDKYGMTTPAYACIDNFGAQPILPELAIVAEGDDVQLGSEATLTVYLADGTAPFNYQWLNGLHQVVAEGTIESLDDIMQSVSIQPTYCDDYYVIVTDANGFTASDTARVVVRSEKPIVADFENLWLDSETSWEGPDTKGEEVAGQWGSPEIRGSFVSGSYQFVNKYTPTWGSWSGFAYSNRTSTEYKGYGTGDDCNSIVGYGYDHSTNYAVLFDSSTVQLLNSQEGAVVQGFYATNSAWTVDAILNGDGMTDKFTTGDHFTLVITGYNGTEVTGTVEFKLADYTSENEEEHYYVKDWQYVDLTSLGTVTSLSFSFSGGHRNNYGLTTPAYACIDNLGADKPADAIHSIQQPGAEAVEAIYDANGRKLSSLQRGINIVRTADGKTRRILVK